MTVHHLDNKNLVPFFKRRGSFRMPGMAKSPEEEMLEQVDPNLRPEDEGVIRRYLSYADKLLGTPDVRGPEVVSRGGTARSPAGSPQAPEKPAREAANGRPETTRKDKAA